MPGDTAILGEGGNGNRERRIARLLVGGRMLRRTVCVVSFLHTCFAAGR